MKINDDHMLCHDDGIPYPFKLSPNFWTRFEPSLLLMHYTVGSTAESAINHLTTSKNKVSAHLVISRTGEITQLVPFDKQAWHAGFSYWEQKSNINRYAIGIELDNDGPLKGGPGQWRSPSTKKTYPDEQVMTATHWKEFREKGWLKFPEPQIQATLEVAKLLKEHYQLVDVIGHEDVSRSKIDPGPAFPMEWFRKQMFDRTGAVIEVYETDKKSTIYQETETGDKPNVIDSDKVILLPRGTPVKVRKTVSPVPPEDTGRMKTQKKKFKKARKKEKGKKGAKNAGAEVDPKTLLKLIVARQDGVKVTGWVAGDAVQQKKTIRDTKVFLKSGNKPIQDAAEHRGSPFKEETKLRILRIERELALVASLERKFVQGWVRKENLVPQGKFLYSPIDFRVDPLPE